jgi:phosphocarrier protein
MMKGTATVAGELGLHLRAAARLVSITSQARGPVRVSANGATVDGKSLLGITSLLAGHGTQIAVEVDHDDDAAVLQEVLELVAGGPDTAG